MTHSPTLGWPHIIKYTYAASVSLLGTAANPLGRAFLCVWARTPLSGNRHGLPSSWTILCGCISHLAASPCYCPQDPFSEWAGVKAARLFVVPCPPCACGEVWLTICINFQGGFVCAPTYCCVQPGFAWACHTGTEAPARDCLSITHYNSVTAAQQPAWRRAHTR